MRGCARRISRRAFRPTYLSGELNTSRPGERGSKALPRRPMRVDAASEPSARDAARGVIGLSAFANNRKGDARSADTCVVCASMDHARVSVSLSRSCVEYKWEKYLHSIPCVVDRRSRTRTRRARPSCTHREIRASQTSKNARENAIAVIMYARHPSVAPVVPVSSPRHHHRSSSSSVVLPHPPPRCVLVASSVVAPTWSSRASHSHDGRRPDAPPVVVFSTCPSVFHVSELCIFIDACARRSGSGFSYRFIHVCVSLSSSSFQFQFHPRRRTRPRGRPRVGHVETSRVGVDKRI
jgi:hypothetical protein